MEDKILMTYALLAHLKETHKSDKGSLIKIFEPIVKKSIVEYAEEKGTSIVMGKNISEIQTKIKNYFGIEIPNGVLSTILRQVSDEINDDNIFAFHNHGSFIIKTYIFNELNEDIEKEKLNIEDLQDDYKQYCELNKCIYKYQDLLDFIFALNIDLFSNQSSNVLAYDFSIPTYIKLKLNDKKIFKIISDIYLGKILSSYLGMKITAPVTNAELLLDTNFFISLIDLNTEEAYLTCNQLYKLCQTMGFKFSILYSTVEQIKILLNTRIQDFANKEIGFIKEADVFGACIRKNLDKTQLERIKDKVDSLLRQFDIDVIVEARILKIIDVSKKSQKYIDLIERRHGNRSSALNDTVAYYYVNSKRGNNVTEFSEVKCWFLHNSYKTDYESNLGYKIYERNTINANELLTLLWLTNPNQLNIDSDIIAKGGLATYVAKYRCLKMPSTELIKQINEKAKTALKYGKVQEKDIYSIGIRMSEGHLANNEAEELVKMADEQFINVVKEYSKQDEEIRAQFTFQNNELKEVKLAVQNLANDNQKLKDDNAQIKFDSGIIEYINKRDEFVRLRIISNDRRLRKYSWFYFFFVLIVSSIWFIDKTYSKVLNPILSLVFSFLLMLVALIIVKFVDHKTILYCLKYTLSKKFKTSINKDLQKQWSDEYELKNIRPIITDYRIE